MFDESGTMLKRYSILAAFILLAFQAANAQPGSDYPTYDPSQQLYMDLNARLLAEDIRQLYGGGVWSDSLIVSFDFVSYTSDDRETARHHQIWNRLTDEAVLSGVLDDNRPYEVRFTSYTHGTGTMTVDSVPIPEAYQATSLETARKQLTKNLRWLLLPMQLLDSNVHVERLQDTTFSGKSLNTLKVSFIEDSTIAAENFILYVNPVHKNIERWRPTTRGIGQDYIWRLYRRVGPFLISTKRWADDFKSYIQLENIEMIQLTPEEIAKRKESQKDPG